MKYTGNEKQMRKGTAPVRALLAGFVLMSLMLLHLPVTAYAAPPLLIDEADVLDDAEEAALLQELTEVSNAHDADVVVVIAEDLGGEDALVYADDYFDSAAGHIHDDLYLSLWDPRLFPGRAHRPSGDFPFVFAAGSSVGIPVLLPGDRTL